MEDQKEECQQEEQGREDTDLVSPVKVNVNLDSYPWDLLDSGHMRLHGMLHRRKMWKLDLSKEQLIASLKKREVCQRHRKKQTEKLILGR